MKCDGSCESHTGEVKHVVIHMTQSHFDGLEFDYCQTAIDEDIKNGFKVEIAERSKNTGEVK